MKPSYRRLNSKEKFYLCEFIRPLIPIARDDSHCMRVSARGQISNMMWRWTADGFCEKQSAVKWDSIKYNNKLLPATKAAIQRAEETKKNRGLIHEHVVPRMLLAKKIISEDLKTAEIYEFLTRYCTAVIVTKEEDSRLSKSMMPDDWEWNRDCVFARYRHSLIFDSIIGLEIG